MAESPSPGYTWLVNKVTLSAIEAAQDYTRKEAENFSKQRLATHINEFTQLWSFLKVMIQRSSDGLSEGIAESAVVVEMTKIQKSFLSSASDWRRALDNQRKGDSRRMNTMLADFQRAETRMHDRLKQLHSLLMGTGDYSSGRFSGGYIKAYESALYIRLSDQSDLHFHVSHYYASIQNLLQTMIQIQILGCYFYRCANRAGPQTESIVSQISANVVDQKRRFVDCMPTFITTIKPNFEEPSKSSFWWQLSLNSGYQCLTIKNSVAWYSKETGYLVYERIGPPASNNQWRFEPPLLPNQDLVESSVSVHTGILDHRFTHLVNRLSELPLSFSGIPRPFLSSKQNAADADPAPLSCKIIPLKNKPGKPTFKVIGISRSAAGAVVIHDFGNGASGYNNPFKEGKEFVLVDSARR
ncbi:hypothetical protein IQ07DRAFT_636048 [Pyrenochaeta sp. DS3sAY3a]|nr:hypothetical protein IQ07DRAFT_636048 [Pyrenochaeta sp. DS3sAY3a]